MRWNYAFWRQNQLTIICDSTADPAGATRREQWAKEEGLWYDLADGEDSVFNQRGAPLTKRSYRYSSKSFVAYINRA